MPKANSLEARKSVRGAIKKIGETYSASATQTRKRNKPSQNLSAIASPKSPTYIKDSVIYGGTAVLSTKNNQEHIPFPISEDDTVVVGFHSLELKRPRFPKNKDIEFNVTATPCHHNILKLEGVDLKLRGLSEVSSIGVTFLKVASYEKQGKPDNAIQTGTSSITGTSGNLWRIWNGTQGEKVLFTYPFSTAPPRILLWIKGAEFAADGHWNLAVEAINVTKTGFTLSWSQKKKYEGRDASMPPFGGEKDGLKAAEVSWIAFPADAQNLVHGSIGGLIKRKEKDAEYPVSKEKAEEGVHRVWHGINEFRVENSSVLGFDIALEKTGSKENSWVFDVAKPVQKQAIDWSKYVLGADYIGLKENQ